MRIRPMVNGQGAAQQTAAAQMILQAMPRSNGNGRRRAVPRRPSRPSARRATARPAAVRASAKRPARLVKGSRAAKAYMAKIRGKRGR